MKSRTAPASAAQRGELNFSSLSLYRNALYGVAALWIVLFHGVILDKVDFSGGLRFFGDTLKLGNIGVDIFVLLSGMGLFFAYSKKPKLAGFYYKRFLRIYLPYFLMGVPYLVYTCFVIDSRPWVFVTKVLTVNYWMGETTPLKLWYVPVILVFYLIYPLIHKWIFLREKNALLRMLLLAALSFALSYLLFRFSKDLYDRYDAALPRLTVFIIGCYFGKLVKEKRRIPVWAVIVSVAVIAGAYPLYANTALHGLWRRYYGSLTGVALTIVLSQLFVDLSLLKLDRFFAFFGAFSLEIYIATVIVRSLFTKSSFYGGHVFNNYLIWMAGAVLAAYLISLLEKPLLKLFMKPVQKKT